MKMKSILLLMLALCLTVCLCACGDDTNTEKKDNKTTAASVDAETTAPSVAPSTTVSNDANPTENDSTTTSTSVVTGPTQPVNGKANYTVIVTDEAGNPVPGAFVQLCLESCIPCITNGQGIASYANMDVADYKVSFITVPAGYELPSDNFYFEKDAYEMTLVLKAAN